ncbi:MAG TPA: DUF4442 domain-containing protein [Bacteroidia bacterium]|nr:DUF4442 domain-containing protein [Bacteroidia bacterium]
MNFVLSRSIPFNAPHGFKIVSIKPGETKIILPYRRSNLNHVKGIHACALATLCEYTTGMTLISKISEEKYRIILKSLRLEYHYQAKMNVSAEFNISDEFIEQKIYGPLLSTDAVFLELEIKIHDNQSNHICTGFVNWQIKKWEKVKGK